MHKFTDEEVSNAEVGVLYVDKKTPIKGIFVDVQNADTGGVSCGFFAKEDLLHLLKLIEEIN